MRRDTPETPANLDLVELTVDRAQAALESRAITAEALTAAFLDRIARLNPRLNALLFVNSDALADARAIDRRRAAGESLGPLAGIPIVVKDPMDTVGFPTTAGWRLLHAASGGVDLMPARDAPVVARMRAAGAIVLGKTNVPVLSWSGSHANDSWAGPTINAAARDRVPGGSSAGTATAVAASLAVLGLAEETGGSIQNPASAQGLVGVKPSVGLVPNAGVVPLSSLRDVVGPIARCVRDAAHCLDALAGPTDEDPKTAASAGRMPAGGYAAGLGRASLRGKRLGLYGPGWRPEALDPSIAEAYRRAQAELRDLGADLVEDPFAGSDFAALREITPGGGCDARGSESLPYDLHTYLGRLGPDAALKSFADFASATRSADPFAPGGKLACLRALDGFEACLADPTRTPDMSGFRALRARYLDGFDAVLRPMRLDGLVFPQMRTALPALFGREPIRETTVDEINIAGLPGVTVPAGTLDDGSPFGLIFVGPMWSEAALLGFAYAYEAATRHRRAPASA